MEGREEGRVGVLGPLDGEHQVIVTKTVEGLDGLGTILPAGATRNKRKKR